jgi:hypothetical protein
VTRVTTEHNGIPTTLAPAYRPGARTLGNMQLDPNPAGARGSGGGGDGANDTISRAEAEQAFAARDAANREAKAARDAAAIASRTVTALAAKLGINASDLKLIDAGDGNFDVEGGSLGELTTTIADARQAKLDGQKKRGDWEGREKELNTAFQKQLSKQHQQHQRKVSGLEKYIRQVAVEDRLRSAAHAADAIDENGDGRYADIVQLVRGRVKDTIAVDDQGQVNVSVTILSEDGATPLMKNGKPATERDLIDDFLANRPHRKKSQRGRGPGGGGSGNGAAGAGGRTMATAVERGQRAADSIFGATSGRR